MICLVNAGALAYFLTLIARVVLSKADFTWLIPIQFAWWLIPIQYAWAVVGFIGVVGLRLESATLSDRTDD